MLSYFELHWLFFFNKVLFFAIIYVFQFLIHSTLHLFVCFKRDNLILPRLQNSRAICNHLQYVYCFDEISLLIAASFSLLYCTISHFHLSNSFWHIKYVGSFWFSTHIYGWLIFYIYSVYLGSNYIYCVIYTVLYILYHIYCIIYTVSYILYLIYCIIYTVLYILYYIYCIMYTVFHLQ